MHSDNKLFCRNCSNEINSSFSFCPKCGARVNSTKNSLRLVLAVSTIAMIVGASTWFIAENFAGNKPTKTFDETSARVSPHTPQAPDPELDSLRAKVSESKNSLESTKNLGRALLTKIKSSESPNPEMVLEAIDVFRQILTAKADDSESLLALADLSFDNRVFSQSATYYEKYLSLNKKDQTVRGRYASTLTFLGKFDEAITELNKIIKEDKDNFQAQAFLAITYAEKGDLKKAKDIGAIAIDIAPTDEARTRLASFLESLGEEKIESQKTKDINEVLKTNSVTSRKFVRSEINGEELKLYFKDFPMEAMPPFAKEKFFKTVKENSEDSVKKIIFIDSVSGKIMEELSK